MGNLTIFLREKEKIDNNIFGHEYYGTKIISTNTTNNIALKLSTDSSFEISAGIILKEGENILISFINNDNKLFSCEIWFSTIYTETDYNKYDQYASIVDTRNGADEETTFDSNKQKYYGRDSFFILTADKEFSDDCNDENCITCLLNDGNNCIRCKDNYKIQFTIDNKTKQCKFIEEEKEEEKEEEEKEEKKEKENKKERTCSNEDVLNNLCSKGNITNEQVGEIYNTIKETSLQPNNTINNTVIQTQNVIFQVSTVENQKKYENPNISSIDFEECEEYLKKEYGIKEEDSLIIIKTDMKSTDFSTTYVQYQIFNPYTLEQLDLEVCNDITININIPVSLNAEASSLFNSLSESGYNLFNTADSFYTDLCTPYTTEEGTDILLEDRKKAIYSVSGNISFCQSGCEFQSYNSTTKKANCDCSVKSEEVPNMDNVEFSQNSVAGSFLDTLSNSNFLVMKCFKLCFSKIGQRGNYGSYLMIVFNIAVLILMIIYCKKGPKIITNNLEDVLIYKIKMKNNRINKKRKKKDSINNIKDVSQKIEDRNSNEEKNEDNNIMAINHKKTKKKKDGRKRNTKNDLNENNIKLVTTRKNNSELNIYKINASINNKDGEENKSNNEPPKKRNRRSNSTKKHGQRSSILTERLPIKGISTEIRLKKEFDPRGVNQNNYYIKNEISIYKPKNKKNNKENKEVGKSVVNEQNILKTESPPSPVLCDEELNSLTYKDAIETDKRTFCQYYWALLKKKHLILFAFAPSTDYNIRVVKITYFLVSFSLYFTISGFFFSDSTMHKVYEDKGSFNFIHQIVQILYTSGVSLVISLILRQLSILDRDIIKIKQEKKIKTASKKSQETKKCILIKFTIYFSLDIILMVFYWYFISCFCAVYKNTQFILIENTLMSFGLSMLYPFGIYLIPAIFRIYSLKAKNKDKECLYKFSGVISLL